LRLVFEGLLPAYRQFHRDLLFHQTEESLFQPFFLGRACQAVLQQGPPWDQPDRIIPEALSRLNDYLGHRPVAVLRTQQKIQPYAHEWVRPIPLFIRGAGVAVGCYHDMVQQALAILDTCDAGLLREALFDPSQLDELAVDPRAYDFDHPANKRPNYLFGQWDMGWLDNSGRCRRFVLQQVSLDAMLARVEERGNLPYEEILFEAAAVLAGTMLMGSGVSGNRPDAHDSSVTLSKLVQVIAGYRDVFYEKLLSAVSGPHAERLRAEAQALRQPLGGARQHFNQLLARRRAEQLQHVNLAQLFAGMGYIEAASRQVRIVPVTSARLRCDMHCRLSRAQWEIQSIRSPAAPQSSGAERSAGLNRAVELVDEVWDLLQRAIECGAVIDPWNILGFGGQYSLFPAVENSVYDHRVDELIDLVGSVFACLVDLQKEAAAAGIAALEHAVAQRLSALAEWWDKFAVIEVSAVDGISGRETCESANHVAEALRAWHQAGTSAGDLAFWRSHAEQFRSAKAYALVVDALLEQRDPVAAMALLVQWLSQAHQIPLVEENYSFHDMALDWMEELWAPPGETGPDGPEARDRWALSKEERGEPSSETGPDGPEARDRWALSKEERGEPSSETGPDGPEARDRWALSKEERGEPSSEAGPDGPEARDRWALSKKFLDYLEANADEYWEVPRLELTGEAGEEQSETELPEDGDGLFSAAYESMSYRDSTDDGFEGDMIEGGGENPTDFELAFEAERLVGRLAFLGTLAELWRTAAAASAAEGLTGPERDQCLWAWLTQATTNRRQLLELLAAVHRYRIPPPGGNQESLVEYDRRRGVKEMLLEQIIATCVETADAARLIRALMESPPPLAERDAWEEAVEQVLRAVLRGDAAAVRKSWPRLTAVLTRQPLLYVALARGGNPQRIVMSRGMQSMLRRLLAYLPRLGLLQETSRLMTTIHEMESNHPVGPGAITEFDQMFRIGCKAMVRCVVQSSEIWRSSEQRRTEHGPDADLIVFLEQLTEALLHSWLMHSRGVRLSTLETVSDKSRWHGLKQFIERYGHDLFTQRFMNLGNLRAIQHEGAAAYLEALAEEPGADEEFRLLAELGGPVSREEAAHWLSVAVEAVVENYAEYVDYNSTTTQSDRGEMLYTLLDFLRLLASYNRMAWNLQPVVLTHEVLVRSGRDDAAEVWRRAVAERTASIAADHLKQFMRLNRKYGMRLPSVAERLEERFVRPLAVDRLRALVRPAIEEARAAGANVTSGEQTPGGDWPCGAFYRLEEGLAEFTRHVSGAGFDVPAWLDALQQEADRAGSSAGEDEDLPGPLLALPQVRLSKKEIRRQLQAMLK
jgi:hypothetical protein